MKVNIFVSSNIDEFAEERKIIKEEIEKDSLFKDIFDVYLFEDENAKSDSADKIFINEAKYADIYLGLIGSQYGEVYRKGFSATEYEYDTYISNKADAYIFVKNVYERDKGSKKFLDRISKKHLYKSFNNPQELVDEVKNSLKNFLIEKASPGIFDERILETSSCDDVDPKAWDYSLNT